MPLQQEPDGDVLNVLGCCGWLVPAAELVLPHAATDRACRFARVGWSGCSRISTSHAPGLD